MRPNCEVCDRVIAMPSLLIAFWAVLFGYALLRVVLLLAAAPLHRRIRRMARELAADPAYAGDEKKIKSSVDLAFMGKVFIAFAVGFPLIAGFLIKEAILTFFDPSRHDDVRLVTSGIESDDRYDKLVRLGIISSGLISPVAALWLLLQLGLILAVEGFLSVLARVLRRTVPPEFNSITRTWINALAHHRQHSLS